MENSTTLVILLSWWVLRKEMPLKYLCVNHSKMIETICLPIYTNNFIITTMRCNIYLLTAYSLAVLNNAWHRNAAKCEAVSMQWYIDIHFSFCLSRKNTTWWISYSQETWRPGAAALINNLKMAERTAVETRLRETAGESQAPAWKINKGEATHAGPCVTEHL